jgi:hypothetical protein
MKTYWEAAKELACALFSALVRALIGAMACVSSGYALVQDELTHASH